MTDAAPKFATQEWLESFRQALNNSADFRSAAKSWNDDALYVIESDPTVNFPEPVGFYMKWKDGEVIKANVLSDPTGVTAVFQVNGTYSAWKQVYASRMEAGVAFLTGKFKFRGPFAKAALNIHGEVLMLQTAFTVPTEFLNDTASG